jgi:hypothetical protein
MPCIGLGSRVVRVGVIVGALNATHNAERRTHNAVTAA